MVAGSTKYLGQPVEITNLLKSIGYNMEYVYFSYYEDDCYGSPKIVFLKTPMDKGFFLQIYEKKGFFRKKLMIVDTFSITMIKSRLIPALAELAENGYLFGWSNPVCEEITKKLAVIEWQPFIFLLHISSTITQIIRFVTNWEICNYIFQNCIFYQSPVYKRWIFCFEIWYFSIGNKHHLKYFSSMPFYKRSI